MGVGVVAVVLAAEFSAVTCIMLGSDNASHDEDEVRSLTDLDIQDVDDVLLEGSSGVEEEKIKLVMEKAYCARQEAVNALLSHFMNTEDAMEFIKSNKEEVQSFDSSSSVPAVRMKPLPSGRVWGVQSEIGTVSFREASSQIGGNVDPDGRNLGETVVVTASHGFPRNEEMDDILDKDKYDFSDMDDIRKEEIHPMRDLNDEGNVTLGIKFENDDGIVFSLVIRNSWVHQHTNLEDYESKKYSFTKINSHTVSNRKEFFKVMNSLSPGDPVVFTLAKQLYTQGEGVNELCSACRSGDLAIFKRVLERNEEIDVNTGLEGNDEDLVKRYGKRIKEGSTPLHVACYHGSLLVVQELVNRPDIQVNKENNHNETPLHLACVNSQSGVVRILLKHPDVNVNKSDENIYSPLHFACMKGDADIVQQLIERPEINVNATEIVEQTPLMFAAENGFPMVVKCLLTHPEIDTTKKDWDNKTALMIASEVFEVLEKTFLMIASALMMASEKRVKEEYDDDDFDADRINKARKEIIDILTEYENKKKSNQM